MVYGSCGDIGMSIFFYCTFEEDGKVGVEGFIELGPSWIEGINFIAVGTT